MLVYEIPSKDDGFRILVDRLWPRGVSKEKAKLNLWIKDIAPSKDLRKWFSLDPEKWEDFQIKYKDGLKDKNNLINEIKSIESKNKIITLLYSAKDEEHNNAVVLEDILNRM